MGQSPRGGRAYFFFVTPDSKRESGLCSLEHDPRFLRRIERARDSLRAGHGVRLEDLEKE